MTKPKKATVTPIKAKDDGDKFKPSKRLKAAHRKFVEKAGVISLKDFARTVARGSDDTVGASDWLRMKEGK